MDFVEKVDAFIETSTGIEELQHESMHEELMNISYDIIVVKLRGISSAVLGVVDYYKYIIFLNKTLYIRIRYTSTYGNQVVYTKLKLEEHQGGIRIIILPDDEYIDFMKMTLG
nr:MAG TPA: hypothetical protein [Caudoviricetes sp.]